MSRNASSPAIESELSQRLQFLFAVIGDESIDAASSASALGLAIDFWPAPGVDRATCPSCGWEWYISWSGSLAKIRKPVWENWERQLAEAQETKG